MPSTSRCLFRGERLEVRGQMPPVCHCELSETECEIASSASHPRNDTKKRLTMICQNCHCELSKAERGNL